MSFEKTFSFTLSSTLALAMSACGGSSGTTAADGSDGNGSAGAAGSSSGTGGGQVGATGGASGSGGAGTGGASAGGAPGTGGTSTGTGGATGGSAGMAGMAGSAGVGMAGAGGSPSMCRLGYTGPTCSECALGFEDVNGACVDVCDDFCERGACSHDTAGDAVCACDEGYDGAECDQCASGYVPQPVLIGSPILCALDEPPTDNMVVWLDADDDDSFTIVDGKVDEWYSRTMDIVPFGDGAQPASRPVRQKLPNERAWVHFDGVDDRLRKIVSLQQPNYQIFIVAQASNGSTETLLSGVSTVTDFPQLSVTSSSSGTAFRAAHFTPGTFISDNVTVSIPTSVPFYGEVRRNGSALLANFRVWNGTSYESDAPLDSPTFSDTTLLQVGSVATTGDLPLDGRIGEIIVYAGPAALADADKVRDYLKAKWRL